MGLPDSYILPEKYNEAYHLTGDGVVVPVVRHLSKFIFEPIIDSNYQNQPINPEQYVKNSQTTLI